MPIRSQHLSEPLLKAWGIWGNDEQCVAANIPHNSVDLANLKQISSEITTVANRIATYFNPDYESDPEEVDQALEQCLKPFIEMIQKLKEAGAAQ